MKSIEKKIAELTSEIKEDNAYLYNLQVEHNIVTDQYMNGNITAPVGKYQRRLRKEMDKVSKRLDSNKVKLNSLLGKYNRSY